MSLAALRALLRELRQLDGKKQFAGVSAARSARALLAPEVLKALTGSTKGSLYRPLAPPLQDLSSTSQIDDYFRLWVRQHLREQETRARSRAPYVDCEEDEDDDIDNGSDGALAIAAAGVANTVMRSPLPSCQGWQPSIVSSSGLHVVENPGNIMQGDYLLGHPSLAEDGIGGCVAIVLRHSHLDTLCLLLNVDADVLDNAQVPNSSASMLGHLQSPLHPRRLGRMPRRPHVCLPPLAAHDPRQVLPRELQSVPLRYGGAHPAPLHVLHSVPLLSSAAQTDQWQRLSGWEVRPGLWCSYVDEELLAAAREALEQGRAVPQQFGAFVGMISFDPGCLANSVRQNHWIPIRSLTRDAWQVPPQGWVAGGDGLDDRHWGSWRDLLTGLGGEYAEWAKVDWMLATQRQFMPCGFESEFLHLHHASQARW